jgi:hypothetical protein
MIDVQFIIQVLCIVLYVAGQVIATWAAVGIIKNKREARKHRGWCAYEPVPIWWLVLLSITWGPTLLITLPIAEVYLRLQHRRWRKHTAPTVKPDDTQTEKDTDHAQES